MQRSGRAVRARQDAHGGQCSTMDIVRVEAAQGVEDLHHTVTATKYPRPSTRAIDPSASSGRGPPGRSGDRHRTPRPGPSVTGADRGGCVPSSMRVRTACGGPSRTGASDSPGACDSESAGSAARPGLQALRHLGSFQQRHGLPPMKLRQAPIVSMTSTRSAGQWCRVPSSQGERSRFPERRHHDRWPPVRDGLDLHQGTRVGIIGESPAICEAQVGLISRGDRGRARRLIGDVKGHQAAAAPDLSEVMLGASPQCAGGEDRVLGGEVKILGARREDSVAPS